MSSVSSRPLRSTLTFTVSPGVCLDLIAFRSSAVLTVSPANSVMTSPLVRPARSAALNSLTSRMYTPTGMEYCLLMSSVTSMMVMPSMIWLPLVCASTDSGSLIMVVTSSLMALTGIA